MNTLPDVVVVGSYVQDLSFRCPAFPKPGETVLSLFATGPGGKGSNQAIAASRAGASTLFVGAVGDDAFGREARAFYRSEHTACLLAAKAGASTGAASILVNASGQNQIAVAPGANLLLRKSELPARALRHARVVVTQLEASLQASAHALRTGKQAGAVTVLNPAPMSPDFSPALLRDVDILIPNETEFAALVRLLPGCRRPRFAEQELVSMSATSLHRLCRAFPVPTVIVTLGARGCFLSHAGGFTVVPAHQGIKVVDTTGAGDAFVGGFAAGLVKFGGDLERAARFGNAVAALSVTRPGTAPSMPRAKEIARFLKSRL